MTCALYGVGVSRGCAIGKSFVLARNQPEIVEHTIPENATEEEVKRFQAALASAKQQLLDIRGRLPASLSTDVTAFIDTHLLMLDDSILTTAPADIIRGHHCNAEWALKIQRDLLVRVFDEMDDPYLRSRKDDVDHVVHRIQRILLTSEFANPEAASPYPEGRVVIADQLTPADTILFQHQGMLAFVTEHGGPLSHTAILARSLGIPAVVGVHNARRYLGDDELLAVDGNQGVVLVDIDTHILEYYHWRQRHQQTKVQALDKIKSKPAISRDGVSASLWANIELPEDAPLVRQVNAAGVGLYRTEFLFMNRSDIPDEEEHLASYLHVLKTLEKQPITIRTLDLGADKTTETNKGPMVANPALGLRAIRLCLKDLTLFRPQLRAILRASAFGSVRLMIPMLSNAQEIFQVLRLVKDTKRELRERGQPFNEHMPVGAMIEVPAAAICASYFARYMDFLSIGTNDLIQYALAIDRVDDKVNYLYDPLHPAVLHLIHRVIEAGKEAEIPVSMCGEMAGDPRYTRLLLGLGLTHFSMHPTNLLEVKQVVRDSHVVELSGLVQRILKTTEAERLAQLLDEITDI